jgi:O-antigen ligase
MALTAIDRTREPGTVPGAPRPPLRDRRGPLSRLLRDPASWAVAVSVLVAVIPLTRASAVLRPWAVAAALLLLVPALAVARPWRSLGALHLLALAPAAAALVVCLTAPTGFDGVDEVAAYAYAGLLYLLVVGHVLGARADQRPARLALLAGCVLVGALDQALTAWWPWFGGQDSSVLMVGTFYWHNQLSAFAGATGAFGLVLAVRGGRRLRLLGGVVAVVSVPLLLLSASRGGLLCALIAWTVVLVGSILALRSGRGGRRRDPVTVVALPAFGLLLTALLSSPVLMASSGAVSDNLEGRQSFGGNSWMRVEYAKAGFELAAVRPLTGAGFDSFHGAGSPLLPSGAQPTTDVHNGYVQAFSDGGLVLGGAVVAATLAPFVLVLRRHRRASGPGAPVAPVGVAALLALGVLALHSAMDFDWTYPALLALYAVLAGLVVGTHAPRRRPDDDAAAATPESVTLLVAIVGVLLVALPASARSGVVNGPGTDAPAWSRISTAGLSVADVPEWARGAGDCRRELLRELDAPTASGSSGSEGRAVDPAVLVATLDCTASAAEQSPSLALIRARGFQRLGRGDEVAAEVEELVARHGEQIPELVVAAAALPHDSGDDAAAVAALDVALRDPRVLADASLVRFATAQRDAWRAALE